MPSVAETAVVTGSIATVTKIVSPAAAVAACVNGTLDGSPLIVPNVVGVNAPSATKVLLVTDNAGLVTLAVRDLPVPF